MDVRHLRLRKNLDTRLMPAIWPPGAYLLPLRDIDPRAIHALLVESYANGFGEVAPFEQWWDNLNTDDEFDPSLVLIPAANSVPIGLCQSWTSAFIKDIVVTPGQRGRGLGEALLWHAFALFQARGAAHVDLKVDLDNTRAQRLYHRVGMVQVFA